MNVYNTPVEVLITNSIYMYRCLTFIDTFLVNKNFLKFGF